MRAARDKCGKPFSVLYGLSEEVAAGSRGVAFPRWSFFQHDSRRGAVRRVRAAKVKQGGHSVRVPPLPIPNREVKPHHADGTAKVGE